MDLEPTLAGIAPNLLRFCLGMAGNRAIGEELAQEALTALVRYWRQNGAPESPQSFVYTVARRLALRARWRRRLFVSLESVASHRAVDTDLERASRGRDELASALRALERLSTREREAILLAMTGELDTATAADLLGISVSAFKMRVCRARRRLLRAMEQFDEERRSVTAREVGTRPC